jgi:hypothetical protein
MAILKIKVVDAADVALAGQSVKVSGTDTLKTNGDGLTQFLIDSGVSITIEINGVAAWSGDSGQLAKDEKFKAAGTGFVRVS